MIATAAALLISCFLGKDMAWDTLDYHFYAGFSALHDRFSQDYFAAGTQSYFNPYIYVPFYLIATSGISALGAASVLAAVQSGILWLTYELALAVTPAENASIRTTVGICATLLAVANPILLNQFGSSSADVLTSEIVLAGWLLLIRATCTPRLMYVVCAGLLLGVASALKLTNSLHALSGCIVLLFLPATWRMRARHAVYFGVATGFGFAIVAAGWSILLERHFGNPLFPLLNGVFRSPQFLTAHMRDLRFVPDSLRDALWRPIAMAAPVSMVDDEFATPDLRYAILLVLAALTVLGWIWYRLRPVPQPMVASEPAAATRPLAALGCGFLLDWLLWLAASGNGRYFIPMACVAAVLVVAIGFRILGGKPKLRNYAIVVVLAAQVLEVSAGATYRPSMTWDGGAWFEVSVPKSLVAQPDLYLTFGEQSHSFLIPFLSARSGFINLDGDYVLGPEASNGEHIRALIRKYSPNLRMIVPATDTRHPGEAEVAEMLHVNDTLAHFSLRAGTESCLTVAVRNAGSKGTPAIAQLFITCPVVPSGSANPALVAEERGADLVFNRLERSCPELFQPSGTVTSEYGDETRGYGWIRRYENTSLSAVITTGMVELVDPVRGGPRIYLGRESDWERTPLKLLCWRHRERYHAVVLPLGPTRSPAS